MECWNYFLLVTFFYSFSFFSKSNCTELNITSLKQIHLVFRHGERSPTETYPTDPNGATRWADGLGLLTNKGKLQMFTLGQNMRKKYGNYIPKYYFPKDIKVLSSYSDRCLMSAELFTSGMFVPTYEQIWNPELLWQPVPISYEPRNKDNMIAAKRSCKKYDDLYEELFSSPKYKIILKNSSELFDYLTKCTGRSIDTLRKVEELYNTLEIEKLNNMILPQWTKDVFPAKMKSLATLSLASFTETDYMKKIKGGPFIKKVLENMKQKLIYQESPKLFFYSGHDITLVNILRTLGLIDEIKPKFAAYLILELHNTTEPVVKIIYNNCGWCKEEEFTIKNNENPITLKKFEETFKPLVPAEWSEECGE